MESIVAIDADEDEILWIVKLWMSGKTRGIVDVMHAVPDRVAPPAHLARNEFMRIGVSLLVLRTRG